MVSKLLFLIFLLTPAFTICPDHGKKSAFDGNTKFAGKKEFCEYQHPLDSGGVHKFWSECE